MIVFKGFKKDLTCRGYKFKKGVNVTEKANCAQNGFHAAEDPLDCLSYYPDIENSVYWMCEAGGDIDEDGNDSKISCTRLELLKEIDITELMLNAIIYRMKNKNRNPYYPTERGKAVCRKGRVTVIRGKKPRFMGEENAYVILLTESEDGKLETGYALRTDGNVYIPGVWYEFDGEEVRIWNNSGKCRT